MLRRIAGVIVVLFASAILTEAFVIDHVRTLANSPATVTLVAGSFVPQSVDNSHPSVSRWAPSCLDSTWGAGCNVASQTCIAPTSGTPDEPCQPPLNLYVTGGTGNGTTATINYHSSASYAFPVGAPLNVSAATQTAWNTQTARVTSYSIATSGCSGTDQCVTLGFSPSLAAAFRTDDPIYVGGMGGNGPAFPGFSATFGYGWGVSGNQYQGPNGQWTAISPSTSSVKYDVQASFPSGISGSLDPPNALGYNGTVTQPWVVSASSCIGTSCSVSFKNSTACASSCVSATTQIVAGQFDDPILAWDTGPIAPEALEGVDTTLYPGHMVKKCVLAGHLSPMQFVAFSINGGAWVKATSSQLDPWGVGANPIGDKVNNTIVYCAQFDATTLADGQWEMRAIACPTAGPCGILASAITAEASTGSTTLKSMAHGLTDTYRLGLTNVQDPVFKAYNGGLLDTTLSITGATFHSDAPTCGSGVCVVYTFTQPSILPPIPKGTLVNVTGSKTNNSCPITGGSDTGGAITYTYSGGCSFPVGTELNISGVTVSSLAATSIGACTYTSGTGDVAITLPSATWGTTPQTGLFYTISGVTGTNAALVNGSKKILASSSSGGTVLHFTIATGQTVSCTGTPVVTGNTYPWNTQVITGGRAVTNNWHYAVISTNGSSNATMTGMSTAQWSSGGTIEENWNDHCVTVNTAASGTITCPLPTGSASTTLATLGSIQINQNLYTVVGGPGDNPSPFDPAYVAQATMTGDSFNIVPFLSDTGNYESDDTGCHLAPCGIAASMNSTIWLWRRDAGTNEQIDLAMQRAAAFQNDGSMFGFVNPNGTIQETDGYVDSWNPSGATSGCLGTKRAAIDTIAAGPTYAGSYCATYTHATNALVWSGFNPPSQAVSNAGGCTVFTATVNTGAYIGQPINFSSGEDIGSAGDGSNGLFTLNELYWIVGKPASNQITLSATPGGPCINELAANLSTVEFTTDLSFDNVYVKCNASFGCSGDNTNPETFTVQSPGPLRSSFYALAGWFSVLNDTTNGTAAHSVDITTAGGNGWGMPDGHIHSNVDRNWPNSQITLTPLNSFGPIPGAPTAAAYGVITVTGGSQGPCVSSMHTGQTCETLTYTISDTAWTTGGSGHFSNAVFQAPDPTNSVDGQGLVVQGVTGTTGAWTCGTLTAPCPVDNSTSTSAAGVSSGTVSFVNPSVSGSFSSAGANPIVPVTINIELAPGTLSGTWNGGQVTCANSSTAISNYFGALTPVPKMCVASLSSLSLRGVSSAFALNYGRTQLAWSNCMITNNGGFTMNFMPTVSNSTPSSNGTVNDVITLASGSTNSPVYAFNSCNTGDGIALNNAQTSMTGASDGWDDSRTIDGPNYVVQFASTQGYLVHNQTGIVYMTNDITHNAAGSFDNAGYSWGDSGQWNLGSCLDGSSTSFHVRCVAAGSQTQPGPPTYGYNGEAPPHILHSYATYADYLTGPAAEVTCSGTPCVNSTSRIYVLDTYGIPRYTTLTWEDSVVCGLYPAGVAGGGMATLTTMLANKVTSWQDQDNWAVELPGAPTGTCNDGPTGSASLGWFPVYHADTHFWTISNISIPSEYSNFNPWTFVKGTVTSDEDTSGTGDAEGFLTKGSSQLNNLIINSTTSAAQMAASATGGLKAIVLQNNPMVNYLIENTNLWATNFYASLDIYTYSLTLATPTPIVDVFEVNDHLVCSSGGPTTCTPGGPSMGFPYSQTLDPAHSGPAALALNAWAPEAGSDSACAPNPSGSGQICGGSQALALWPSDAWQVNQSTGVPTVTGKPNLLSLRSCPWYCAATDTGSGLY